ncbi:MAG: hypothetical protein KGZ25_00030 [Planctomycetes bacterium]|nr:hypothetical protein [Planctomycetota bacterium]
MGGSPVPKEMETAVEYRASIKKIRGWCGLLGFFGALMIWQGIQLVDVGLDLAWVGVAIGVALIAVAIIGAIWPSPPTMLAEAIAFGLIAAWDLGLAILSKGEAADLAIWGVIEAGIAVYLLVKLPGFIRTAREKPPKEVLKQLDDVCKEIRKGKPKEEKDLIDFRAGNKRWRARLSGIGTFLEQQKGHDVVFASPSEVSVEDRTKPGKDPKKRPVTLHVADKEWKCKMKKEYLDRLIEWLASDENSETSTEEPQLEEPV